MGDSSSVVFLGNMNNIRSKYSGGNMILNLPNIPFNDNDWIYILINYLKGWTEIPLTTTIGYDLDKLKFYDGFIGYLIKQTEYYLKEYPDAINKDFLNSWKYQGKLYRIIHPIHVKNDTAEDGYSYEMPKIDYHSMITHWTNNYTFNGLMYKLNPEIPYIILEADTHEHIAFDVNKFRNTYDCENPYTAKEQEIIFPMYKDCIKEYYMSANEFIRIKSNSHL